MDTTKLVFGTTVLEVVKGDITQQETEAIVNAANNRLAPGGGVAGAIHKAAGPALWEECKRLGGCQTGEAKLTSGHKLKAKYIIHTVGPVYSGAPHDSRTLQACYLNSLKLADDNGITSISFPAISTGAFGYPLEEAAKISLSTVKNYLEKGTRIKLVKIVLYTPSTYDTYLHTLYSLARS